MFQSRAEQWRKERSGGIPEIPAVGGGTNPIETRRSLSLSQQRCHEPMKPIVEKTMRIQCRRLLQIVAACAFAALAVVSAMAQLAPNQTHGFGDNELVTFTYLQNFDRVDQPKLDLDFNGIQGESDPHEMQTPICQPVTEPTEDPTGSSINKTAHLYVLVPMFSVDNDQDPGDAMRCPNRGRRGELCGAKLGAELIKLFGAVPEAWKK